MALGIGIVGVGLHGSRYASHIARGEVAGVRLAAVARRDRLLGEQRARELGCRFHGSIEGLVHDGSVDAVLVVTPAGAHAQAVLAATRARKPVLVEKPLAHSLDEARELLREVRSQGGRVMVAQTLRWEPVYRKGAELAQALGPVRHAQAFFLKGDFAQRISSDTRTDYHRAVYACGIHQLDWAGLVFPGGFVRAHAHESPGEDGLSFGALLEARGGGTFSIAVRLKGEGTRDGFSLIAERGALLGDRTEHSLLRVGTSGASREEIGPREPTLPLVLASFRDFALGRSENAVPLEEGVRAVARAEACVRAIAVGGSAAVEEDLP
ncbi:Gfo/Idh/MocA family oxidoreductase [bacterium]|nr:Gfo/Idh/MocA family oxidoreductase [bacterium]